MDTRPNRQQVVRFSRYFSAERTRSSTGRTRRGRGASLHRVANERKIITTGLTGHLLLVVISDTRCYIN